MKRTTTIKKCKQCQICMSMPLWKTNKTKFCSRKCSGLYIKEKNISERKKQCLLCSKNFTTYIKKQKYCSIQCYWNDSFINANDFNCLDCSSPISKIKGVIRCKRCNGKTRCGDKHPMWKGGARRDIHSLNNPLYRDWRQRVFFRDKFTCQIKNDDCSDGLQAHHILRWSEYPELRYELNNGISLCSKHHPRKKSEEHRLMPLFNGIISNNK